MRKLMILISIFLILAVPVSAMDYTAPEAPEDAQELIPESSGSFGRDLWTVITRAVSSLRISRSIAGAISRFQLSFAASSNTA